MGILYIIIGFIVASIFLFEMLADGYLDMEVAAAYGILALFVGLIWPVAIWVMLVKWGADGETPHLVKRIKSLYSYFKDN